VKRRNFIIISLAAIPALAQAQAQSKPPTRTPSIRPKPTETPEPIYIDTLTELDYRTRMADLLGVVIGAFNLVQSKSVEAIKFPARAKQQKWASDYVAQAVTASNGATEMFALDPPENMALPHVYFLRYAKSVDDAIDKFSRALDASDIDGVSAAQDLAIFAKKEFEKAVSLLPK
jgi:hypothetical protein